MIARTTRVYSALNFLIPKYLDFATFSKDLLANFEPEQNIIFRHMKKGTQRSTCISRGGEDYVKAYNSLLGKPEERKPRVKT
jgi:hypothetical protein